MKLKYFFLSMAVAATALVGFSSCSDDDNDGPVVPGSDTDLVLAEGTTRVKIGEENRVALPIESGAGQYNAFSLNPDVADIYFDEAGTPFIEGFKNGSTQIVVSDASGKYKKLPVAVYTTDQLTLTHTDFNFETPLGIEVSNSEAGVALGNGGYEIASDNEKVVAAIEPENGAITLRARSGKDEYVATVTVTDQTGLTAEMKVTVTPTFDPFTAEELEELTNNPEEDCYILSPQIPSNRNYDFDGWGRSYGTWKDAVEDGNYVFGWWELWYGTDYGGHYIIYPATATVGQEVDATYKYKYNYSWSSNLPPYELQGKAKVLRDDDWKVVVWWNVDMENECIERGWVMKQK